MEKADARGADWIHSHRISSMADACGDATGGAFGWEVSYTPLRNQLPVPCAAAGPRVAPVGGALADSTTPPWVSLLAGGPNGAGGQRLAYEADIAWAFVLQRN